MRISATLIAVSILTGASAFAAPGIAEAQAGAIADAVVAIAAPQPTQFSAQQRSQRASRRAAPQRTPTQRPQGSTSPYVYPGSRGALLNCSFC
jgi:hypothetical protein